MKFDHHHNAACSRCGDDSVRLGGEAGGRYEGYCDSCRAKFQYDCDEPFDRAKILAHRTVIIGTSPHEVQFLDNAVPWRELHLAANQEDEHLRNVYRHLVERAEALERERLRAAIAACSAHKTTYAKTYGFSGQVPRCIEPNPAAHGNITDVEHCRCGAVRYININQNHIETGRWGED